jgi:hypothetical protein
MCVSGSIRSDRVTLQYFWNYGRRSDQDDTANTNLTNYVKATLLFNQAVQISMKHKPGKHILYLSSSRLTTTLLSDIQQAETQSFTSEFQLVSHMSDKLLSKLPPLYPSPSTRLIYHTHALVHDSLKQAILHFGPIVSAALPYSGSSNRPVSCYSLGGSQRRQSRHGGEYLTLHIGPPTSNFM